MRDRAGHGVARSRARIDSRRLGAGASACTAGLDRPTGSPARRRDAAVRRAGHGRGRSRAAPACWQLGSCGDLDAEDWWFRCRFAGPTAPTARRRVSALRRARDARRRLAERRARRSRARTCSSPTPSTSTRCCGRSNELVIRCRALAPAARRSAGRGRAGGRASSPTRALRWFRTTLFGRMPGFAPGPAPSGRGGRSRSSAAGGRGRRRSRTRGASTARRGRAASRRCSVARRFEPTAATSWRRGPAARRGAARARATADGASSRDDVRDPRRARWWPHTHGARRCCTTSRSSARRTATHGRSRRPRRLPHARGRRRRRGLALAVNGVPVFCRGASLDCRTRVTLDRAERRAATRARAAPRRRA